MTKIKFEVELDAPTTAELSAVTTMLTLLNGGQVSGCSGCKPKAKPEPEPTPEEVKEPKPEEKPKRKRRTKAEIEADKKAEADRQAEEQATTVQDEPEEDPNTEEVKAEAEKEAIEDAEVVEDEPEEDEGLTLEDVREKLQTALEAGGSDFREKAVEKMRELGAKNLSTLPEDKYQEFYDYLADSLK